MTEVDRFERFFRLLGQTLEPFQRLIVGEIFSQRREALVLLPRGNGKTTLLAAVGLWCLLRLPDAQIVVGAASRDQAAVLFDIARGFAEHPEISKLVQTTRREIRTARGWLKVIAADGPKQHGLIIDMAIVDELHAHGNRELYDALSTAMLKRPGAKLVTISTAGATVDTPLGDLYERANQLPSMKRDGALSVAIGKHFGMLEWRADDPDDLEQVKAANPASWVTLEGLESQRVRSHPLAFARYHCNIWTGGKAPFVMPEQWDAGAAKPDIPRGARVAVGVDASLVRDSTAVCVARLDDAKHVHAMWKVWTPAGANQPVPLADVEVYIRDLSRAYDVTVVYDPHYFGRSAQVLEDEGIPVMEWPYRKMAEATSLLLEIIREGRLAHGGDRIARQHAIAAEVDEREWGLVLSKRRSREKIDCMIALAMAAWWANQIPEPMVSIYEERFAAA